MCVLQSARNELNPQAAATLWILHNANVWTLGICREDVVKTYWTKFSDERNVQCVQCVLFHMHNAVWHFLRARALFPFAHTRWHAILSRVQTSILYGICTGMCAAHTHRWYVYVGCQHIQRTRDTEQKHQYCVSVRVCLHDSARACDFSPRELFMFGGGGISHIIFLDIEFSERSDFMFVCVRVCVSDTY